MPKKNENYIGVINDFFLNYDIDYDDLDSVGECIYIISQQLENKVSLDDIVELIKKKFPIPQPSYSNNDIKEFDIKLSALKQIKQPEQRSEEWYEFRKNRLTASDLATALGENTYGNRGKLIAKKCGYDESFKPGAAIIHGIKYEPMANLFYEKLNNVSVFEYGCIPHSTIGHFAASPDGIVDSSSSNKNYIGRMLEIKCPKSRPLNGFVPDYYELQIQGQLEVCDLEYCDYLECSIKEVDESKFYDIDKFKGVIFELYDKTINNYKYIYKTDELSEENIKKWASDELNKIIYDNNIEYIGITYWFIDKYDIILVKRDKKRFDEMLKPKIDIFWNEVLKYRELGYESLVKKKESKPVIKKQTHSFIEDSDD